LDLEAVFDGERTLKEGDTGRGVQAVQHALYDIGFRLRRHGADGDFGTEAKAAVKKFQSKNSLTETGAVDAATMEALDKRFSSVTLPSAATLGGTWTAACVRSLLCPWSPHTIDVLRRRIALKSFDSISWADEEWDGSAWKAAPFPGAGYNTGTEIGVLNSDCQSMSETIYHEVLHAEQPRSHDTTLKREAYAYRIGEEFSIGMGLAGRSDLRTSDTQGRQFADRAKVEGFVSKEYPAVVSSGGGAASREEIIGKAAGTGKVRVQRADGSVYVRNAAVGEKVPGPISLANEKTHARSQWRCP
jgi:hypothetical protein